MPGEPLPSGRSPGPTASGRGRFWGSSLAGPCVTSTCTSSVPRKKTCGRPSPSSRQRPPPNLERALIGLKDDDRILPLDDASFVFVDKEHHRAATPARLPH